MIGSLQFLESTEFALQRKSIEGGLQTSKLLTKKDETWTMMQMNKAVAFTRF